MEETCRLTSLLVALKLHVYPFSILRLTCSRSPRGKLGSIFSGYTTLVVKNFQNGVGDALPPRALQDLLEAVVVHLNECYPKAFGKIERMASGSAEELVVLEGLSSERRIRQELEEIRRHEKTGRPLGEDGFVGRLEEALGRILQRQKPGRKRRQEEE